jgi:exopolysaccharide biosynthesis polyprenyl glycosylphosphotransferase
MYEIGFAKVSELVYAQSLSNVIPIVVIYIAYRFAFLFFPKPWAFLVLIIIQIGFNIIWSYLANKLYFETYPPQKTIVLYRNNEDLGRLDEISKFSKKFDVQEYVQCDFDDYRDLLEVIEPYEVVLAVGVSATHRNSIAKECIDKGKQGYFVPHVGDIIMMGSRHVVQFSVPVMSVSRAYLQPEYLVIKRAIDIILSLLGIIILSPLMAIVAIAIKAYDGGPALYKQTRLTKDGKHFKILKFRSMRVDAEKDGVARLAAEKDDRITPIGKVVRACRFDELPQLFNILKGDMTIVGPRPERPEIASKYEEVLPSFRLRLQVKAGLTGTAQVYGKYNSTPYDKLEMDLLYIKNMSLFEDIKLMFATIRILFLKDSTSGVEAGQVTAVKDVEDIESQNNMAEM